MHLISRSRRPRRKHEWAADKAVTFIVTLAASRSVTLAAKRAGMSRKSAYALKSRDPAFAAAWEKAIEAGLKPVEGDEIQKADRLSFRSPRGNNKAGAVTQSRPSAARHSLWRSDALERELFFAALARRAAPVDK